VLPRPPSWFKGPTSKERGGKWKGGGKVGRDRERGEWKGRGRDARERGGKGGRRGGEGRKLSTPPPSIPAYAPGTNIVIKRQGVENFL